MQHHLYNNLQGHNNHNYSVTSSSSIVPTGSNNFEYNGSKVAQSVSSTTMSRRSSSCAQWYRLDPYAKGHPKVLVEPPTASALDLNCSVSSCPTDSVCGGEPFLTSLDSTSVASGPFTPRSILSSGTAQVDFNRSPVHRQHYACQHNAFAAPAPAFGTPSQPAFCLPAPVFSTVMPPRPPKPTIPSTSARAHHIPPHSAAPKVAIHIPLPDSPARVVAPTPMTPMAKAVPTQPHHPTSHAPALQGKLRFLPFSEMEQPEAHRETDAETEVDNTLLTRMFIGQLTTSIPIPMLAALVAHLAEGTPTYHCDRITRTQKGKKGRAPTGCFHCSVPTSRVNLVRDLLNDSVLVDVEGVWYAEKEKERTLLQDYCASLKENKYLRPPGRPHGTMVVQTATSSFPEPVKETEGEAV